MPIGPGQTIGQYIIQDKLGEGGMGAVYKADQPTIHRAVALKILSASFANDPDALGRFKREVDIIAELEHPYILPVYDYGQVDDNPFIVMRFMGGGTLHQRLRDQSLSQAQIVRVLSQVAEALDYAHARDVIHRDLKPGNVLLDESGNACLADFGLAKTMAGSRDLTTTGSILGTPAYMSPEQARGEKLDARSDIYSFAVLVYQALSGQLPFQAKTSMEYIQKHLTEAPPSIETVAPRLPPAVGAALSRALAKDRASRPAHATELMATIQSALAGARGQADPRGARVDRSGLARTVADLAPPPPTINVGRAETGTRPRPALGWLLAALVVVGGGAVLIVAIAAVLAAVLYGQPGRPKVATYPVGDSPRALLYDGQSVWVANFLASTLTQLSATGCPAAGGSSPDPCGRAINTLTVDNLPVALAGDRQSMWIASALDSTLIQFDPAAGKAVARYHLPNVPSALLRIGTDLWTANGFTGTVTHVALDGTIVGDFPAGHNPVALAYDGGSLWVADQTAGALIQLDPASGSILGTHALGGQPAAVAFDGNHLWAALGDKNEVVEVDPANGSILARVPVGKKPVALLFDGATLWSADQEGNSVTRLNVATARPMTTIAVAGGPYALAWSPCGSGCGDLWIADEAIRSVSRVRVTGP